ncbi:hypothetical protein SDC9_15108 [bioreactor metagenome]|uniref:Uncharacterized protein n=1 Tax=bioreactor metagenome TaxID=1076179 RepID=A0A644TQU9_9ZZZZ
MCDKCGGKGYYEEENPNREGDIDFVICDCDEDNSDN